MEIPESVFNANKGYLKIILKIIIFQCYFS